MPEKRERHPRARARVHPAEHDDVDVAERDEDEVELDEELVGPRRRELPAPRLRRRPRAEERERESLRSLVREIPHFVKLLFRLARDPRVSKVDKAIVVAVAAYVLSPIDLVPDVPFIGQIDDVMLVALAINRLLNNAGVDVLLDHWDGEVHHLEAALDLLDRADSYLPAPLRALLGSRDR